MPVKELKGAEYHSAMKMMWAVEAHNRAVGCLMRHEPIVSGAGFIHGHAKEFIYDGEKIRLIAAALFPNAEAI